MQNVRPGVRFVVHDTHTSPLCLCTIYSSRQRRVDLKSQKVILEKEKFPEFFTLVITFSNVIFCVF